MLRTCSFIVLVTIFKNIWKVYQRHYNLKKPQYVGAFNYFWFWKEPIIEILFWYIENKCDLIFDTFAIDLTCPRIHLRSEGKSRSRDQFYTHCISVFLNDLIFHTFAIDLASPIDTFLVKEKSSDTSWKVENLTLLQLICKVVIQLQSIRG